MNFQSSAQNLLSVGGVIFDIAGATLVVWSIAFSTSRSVMRQSSSAWNFTPSLVKMFSEQRTDAAFGLSLLVVGFLMQGAAGYGWILHSYSLFAISMLALAALLTIYWAIRDWLVGWMFKRACRTRSGLTDARIKILWQQEKHTSRASTPQT